LGCFLAEADHLKLCDLLNWVGGLHCTLAPVVVLVTPQVYGADLSMLG
jgi:hypothetical protein